jgi:hypothetical protein
MEKTKASDTQMAISHIRFMKDKNWRNMLSFKSILLSELDRLSKKSEEELTKSDLLKLIKVNCDYMKALSLYNYYKDEMTSLLTQLNGDKANGDARD